MIDWIRKIFESDRADDAPIDPELRLMLRDSLRECESLYRAGARVAAHECPGYVRGDPRKLVGLMLDLHRGLVVKILIEIGQSDRQWCAAEREVAKVVLRHAWGTSVADSVLSQTLRNVADHSDTLQWDALVGPFIEMPALFHQIPELTALTLRIANLVAKADGRVQPSEAAALRKIERELESSLDRRGESQEQPKQVLSGGFQINRKLQSLLESRQAVAVETSASESKQRGDANDPDDLLSSRQRRQEFDSAMNELDQLVGLEPVKKDIRELIDFMKIQKQREQHGLSTTQISLHTVFEGNPGTGKTTVARILGRLFCGLGMLEKGHTVETDRSGLVAQYAGQTGPRTNQRIDEALHGVLFVDEAYSLISEQGQDAFGVEAIQALLKRMEDDRDRFIVVLAGYPEPMGKLLRSNPGLSSRIQRTFTFPDYSALELLEIFRAIGRKNHYRMTSATKQKLYAHFQHLIEQKNEHFGNGRMVRNVFERSIRRQASRLADVAPVTRKLLTTLEPQDIHV